MKKPKEIILTHGQLADAIGDFLDKSGLGAGADDVRVIIPLPEGDVLALRLGRMPKDQKSK